MKLWMTVAVCGLLVACGGGGGSPAGGGSGGVIGDGDTGGGDTGGGDTGGGDTGGGDTGGGDTGGGDTGGGDTGGGSEPTSNLARLFAALSGGAQDVDAATVTANVVRDDRGEVESLSSVETSTQTIGLARIGDGPVIVTLDGTDYTLNIVNDDDGEYLLSKTNNPELEITTEFAGTSASAYSLTTSLPESGSVGYFVVGDLTNPSQLSGNAIYDIEVRGLAGRTIEGIDGAEFLVLDGSGTITANFETTAIGGGANITRSVNGEVEGITFVDFNGTRTGNTFTADAQVVCELGVVCTSASTLKGGFFGTNGAEVAGTGFIDERETGQIGGVDYDARIVGNVTFQGPKQ